MLFVKRTNGILLSDKKLRAYDEPTIYLCDIVRVPSMSITKVNG